MFSIRYYFLNLLITLHVIYNHKKMKKTLFLFILTLCSVLVISQNSISVKLQTPERVLVENQVKNSQSQFAVANVNNPQKSRGVPASPYPYIKTLSDGTQIELIMRGDGVVHWEETTDGYTVLKNTQGQYVYAAKDKYGVLVPTTIFVNSVDNRTQEELAFLSTEDKYITYSSSQIQAKTESYYSDERSQESSAKSFPTTGSRKLITILVEYPDVSFTRTHSEFNDLFNGSSYNLEEATGSVKQYYSDNSFAQLDLTTDVVGPYTLPNNMAYYGANDGNGNDVRSQEMIEDAIAAANPYVDFSEYDNDGDGWVDGVYVVFAGYSEASGGPESAIWPHRWAISPVTYDGVNIYDYACSNELYGNSGTYITGIGTICHEFGHSCGLNDYYDTDYDGSGGEAFTLGSWDVMDGGAYNNWGMTPPFFNSYSRFILNWQNPIELNSPASVTLLNTAQNNESYYFTTQTTNEYFLIENRQQISWDEYIPHHGMIIYHVDQNYITANGNDFNVDPSYQGFDLIEADNTRTEASRNGDSFPGNTNNTSFTDATTPSALSHSGQNSNKPLTNIQEVGQVVYFDFMGGAVSGVPVADFVADQTSVIVGTTVNFTDLSTGVPDNYSWTFTGGTPDASTASDPSVTYNTPGTYDVTLYVSNSNGNDEITKTAYITVTTAPVTCEFIDNIDDSDNYPIYYESMEDRPLTGINEYGFTAFAEYYNSHLNNLVEGVKLGINKVDNVAGDGIISIKIWDANGGLPSTEIYSEDFDIASFTASSYNTISFATPTIVSDEFFIGYEIYYTTPQDTISVYQVENRGDASILPSTAYVEYNNSWYNFDDIFQDGFNTSLSIYPHICPSPPYADFTADATSGCGDLTVQFTDQSSTNTDSWSWNFGDGDTSTEQNPSHYYDTPGTYTVTLTATNTAGSDVITMTDMITVGAIPNDVVVSGGGTQCGGTMTLIAIGGTGGTIYWQNTTSNGTSTATASSSQSVSISGTYYFRAQSADGCWGNEGSDVVTINEVPTPVIVSGGGIQCGGTATLTATGGTGGTIYWQNTTSNGTSTALASSSEVISTNGTYYFRAQSAEGCWGDEGPASVTINDVPDAVVVTGGGTQCGGTMSLTATGGAGGTIYWQNTTSNGTSTATASSSEDVTATGTFYFRAQSPEGCWGAEGSDDVVINDIPTDVTVSGGGIQCYGTITLTATGGTGGTIYWQNTTTNGTSTVTASDSEEVSATGTYYFRAQSAEGCWGNEDSADVTIHPAVTVEITSTDESAPGANDGSATATVTSGTPEYSYSWNDPGAYTTAVVDPLPAGTWCVTVTDFNGCTAEECVTINTIGAAPVPNINADVTSGCDNLTVIFTDLSINNPDTWTWDFGDGSPTSGDQNPTHTYDAPGVYSITLTAENIYGGNSGTFTDYITVGETPTIDYTTTPADDYATPPVGGTISVILTGGQEPYDIIWDHDPMESSLNLTDLYPGNYYLTVIENFGCSANETIFVDAIISSVNQFAKELSIYPNPTEGNINVIIDGETIENITIVNILGEVVYKVNPQSNKTTIDVRNFANGTYFIKVDIADDSIVRKFIKQ